MPQILSKIKRALVGWKNSLEKMPSVPSDIKNFSIGQTVNKQGILCYQLGTGPTKLLLLGAIHGNEIGTVKLTHRLISWFDQSQYLNLTAYIVPCLNLDGYEKALQHPDYFGGGRIGRVNANNVDLNRNFDVPSFRSKAEWTHGKNYEDSTEVFAGERASSEPEIKALTDFIKKEHIKVILSFHNAGADITANPVLPAEKLAKIFSRISGYRYISPEEWQKFGQTGSSYEWCALNKIALLEIEASNRYGSDWAKQQKAIQTVLDEIAKEVKS